MTNKVELDGEKVHLREGSYVGTYATYTWDIEERQCSSNLQQIYSGEGKQIRPISAKFSRQLLVTSDFHGITFGLDMKKPVTKCGVDAWETQMPNIFVIPHKKNFLRNLEKTRYLKNMFIN